MGKKLYCNLEGISEYPFTNLSSLKSWVSCDEAKVGGLVEDDGTSSHHHHSWLQLVMCRNKKAARVVSTSREGRPQWMTLTWEEGQKPLFTSWTCHTAIR